MICEKIFIDIGANIGVNMRFLYEANKYPHTRFMISEMDRVLGKNRDNVCYYGFEANPNHYNRLQNLSSYFKSRNMKIWNKPVGIHNKTKTFYHANKTSDYNNKEWGFSETRWSSTAVPVQLQMIDFPNWFNININPSSTIMMKIDIEGGEYELLTALMSQGSLCKIHTITMEWHSRFCNNIWCNFKKWLPNFFLVLPRVGCNVRFLYKDDESYLHDGILMNATK